MLRSINCLLRPSFCFYYYKLGIKTSQNGLLLGGVVLRTTMRRNWNIGRILKESIVPIVIKLIILCSFSKQIINLNRNLLSTH